MTNTDCLTYLAVVKSAPDTCHSFVKAVPDTDYKDRIALKRAWQTTKHFERIWNREMKPDFDYMTELATRILSVHDNIQVALSVLFAWCEKYGIEPDEPVILKSLATAEKATEDKREAWRRMEPKVKKLKKEKRNMNINKKKVNRPPKTKTQILQTLRKEGPGTPAEIADRLDINRDTIKKQLQRLVKAGTIIRNEESVYSVDSEHSTVARATNKPIFPVVAAEPFKVAPGPSGVDLKKLYEDVNRKCGGTMSVKDFKTKLANPDMGESGLMTYAGWATNA